MNTRDSIKGKKHYYMRLNNSNKELTGKRDLTYSTFRRKKEFGGCYFTDLDCLEWRPGKGFVAVIEHKEGFNNYPTEFQNKRYQELAETLNIPYYLIQYNTAEHKDGTKEIRELKITKGEHLVVEGQRGSVKVIQNYEWFIQYPEQHVKWIKNL
jgi:hypothetical protein